jgi:hypothetical protein
MPNESSLIFAFEEEFQKTLHCVPMAVRYKLDMAGIKLKLAQWLKLSEEERGELLSLPTDGDEQTKIFGRRVWDMVCARAGVEPQPMAPPKNPVWDDMARVPQDLLNKAHAEGLFLTPEKWAALSRLQRFALTKLSRPNHENKNFLPACQEFGLK